MKNTIVALLLLSLCGCSMAQVRQEFIGISISDVKNSKTRQTQQYDISSDKCLAKIKEALQDMKATVRGDEKNKFIVADNLNKAFRSSIDTTQVGILVTPWEADKSQVDVASGNADLAAFVSRKISEKIKPAAEKEVKTQEAKQVKEGVSL